MVFLAPGAVLYGVFVLYAIVMSIRYSVFNWTGMGPVKDFLGAANYVYVLWGSDYALMLWRAIAHNVLFFLLTLALVSVGGLGIAYCLTLVKERTAGVYQTLFFLPMVVPPVVIAYLWGMYLEPNSGAIAAVLEFLHLDALNMPYLGQPSTALAAVAVITVWASLGYYVFILLPAINDVPIELIEAAKVDGAGRWRTFWVIVLPMIRPTYVTVTTLLFIGAFGVFDYVYILEGPAGGPNYATDVIATLFFRTAFGSTQGGASASMSLASAMAVVGFVIVMSVAAVLIRVQKLASKDL